MLKANKKYEEGNLSFVTSAWLIWVPWLLQTLEHMLNLQVIKVWLVQWHLLQRRLLLLVVPVPELTFKLPCITQSHCLAFILPETVPRYLREPLYAQWPKVDRKQVSVVNLPLLLCTEPLHTVIINAMPPFCWRIQDICILFVHTKVFLYVIQALANSERFCLYRKEKYFWMVLETDVVSPFKS